MSIFTYVKNALISSMRNEKTTGEIQFKGNYPSQVITWFCKNNIFKVANLSKEEVNGKKVYTLKFKDIDVMSDFLKDEYISLEKKGYVGEFANESITNKFGHIYTKYRQELECPNWSSEPDEFGYRANPNSTIGYEKLDKADSCTFEAYVCMELGYTDYQEFAEAYSEEERKVLEEAYESAAEDLKASEILY